MSDRIILVLVVFAAVGIFLLDALLTPAFLFPAFPYAIPILVAAYFLRPRQVGAIAIFSLALQVLAAQLQHSPISLWTLYAAGVVTIGYLAVILTSKAEREKTLTIERARLASIVETSSDAIIGKSTEGIIESWNPAAQRLYGYSAAEVVGKSLSILIPPERSAELNEILERIKRGDRIEQYDTVRIAKDGARIDVSVTISPIRDSAGVVVGASAIARDITERRRMQEELRWLSRAVEQSPATTIITDPTGKIEYVNRKFTELTGYTAEEVQGHNPRILKSGHTSSEEYKNLWETITSGKEWRGEFLNKKKNGDLYWESASISPIRDAQGKTTHFLAVKEDITERKQAEAERDRLSAEIRQRAVEQDTILTNMPDGVLLHDASGEIIRSNPAAERILGYKPYDMQRPFIERLPVLRAVYADGRPLSREDAPVVRALRGETIVGLVLAIDPLDRGKTWISMSSSPVRASDGTIIGAVSVITDINEVHRLQQEREDIMRTVAHDLRNPLGVVLGQAQLIERFAERPGSVRQSAANLITTARRMDAMIQDLVDATQLEAGQIRLDKKRVNLWATVLDLLDRARVSMDVQRVQVQIPEDLSRVSADPNRVDRILTNLISNALKYSAPEGKVVIAARQIGGVDLVEVRDHGIGIAPEDLPYIFERFYQPKIKSQRRGLGLGLYTTRLLVQAHGGRIWAESQPGEGSTFYFTLPVADGTISS